MTMILVIEDDLATAAEIDAELSLRGFTVSSVSNGIEGLEQASAGQWDAIIVDRMLPGMDGLDLIRELRSRNVFTPALVLSALDQVGDRITGLKAGGDDYLTKPFALGELTARLEALTRRHLSTSHVLQVGPLRLDLIGRRASRGCRDLDLLARESQLLEYLMRREDRLVTRPMLLEGVFGYRFEIKTNLIDVHLGRLRRKLDLPEDVPMLKTVRGEGFVLSAPLTQVT